MSLFFFLQNVNSKLPLLEIFCNLSKMKKKEKETLTKDKEESRILRYNQLGRNSHNFLSKFVRFFVTFKCFYNKMIHRKEVVYVFLQL